MKYIKGAYHTQNFVYLLVKFEMKKRLLYEVYIIYSKLQKFTECSLESLHIIICRKRKEKGKSTYQCPRNLVDSPKLWKYFCKLNTD